MSTSQDGFGLVDCKLNCIENVDPATTTTVSTTQSTTTTIENRGAFNNYVDQILPNFDPLPRNCRHFFVHVDKGGEGYVKCPRLSTRGGEGVEIGSKLVHVVIECPLNSL